jgi:putative membrane protein
MTLSLKRLFVRWVILALGIVLSAHVIPGVTYRGIDTLIVVVLLLSVFNVVLRPVLLLFTAPFILLTLGLGIIVINALGFMIVDYFVDGFTIRGFPQALGAALVVGLTSWILGKIFLPEKKSDRAAEQAKKQKPANVIDI